MKRNIKSLAELKEEKRKLMIQREATKQLLFGSLGETRKSATHLLTSKILLPAGVAGAVTWGARKFISSENGSNHEQNDRSNNFLAHFANPDSPAYDLIKALLPIGAGLLSAYVSGHQEGKDQE